MIKVFIVEWNRPDVWEQCAVSWKQNASNRDNIHVFYADNHSPDLEMSEKLSELKCRGLVDNFIVFNEKLHPAIARNHFWLIELANSEENDIFVKSDGNFEALPNWDVEITDYLNNNKDVGCITTGKDEDIDLEHCLHRAYQIIFARQPIVKQFGGFRSYEKETGVLWGCDDIDWARTSLKTKYISKNFQCFRFNERPKQLKSSTVELFKGNDVLRIRALKNQFAEYYKGNYYIGE